MTTYFPQLLEMFKRTKAALTDFMGILEPVIENAKDDHERLYYHHIYEEEEHRFDRLEYLMPKLEHYIENPESYVPNNNDAIHLLQDISLEKFGLHNFLEHLDLALFSFKGTEYEEKLQEMRNVTASDYQTIKELMTELNEQAGGSPSLAASVPTDEKENGKDNLKIEMYTQQPSDNGPSAEKDSIEVEGSPEETQEKTSYKKRLTVGSLKK
ncbi:IMEF encapsulin system ferritin-like cargo protein [Bacillus sp. FJAT-44742]|uniref:IMEF encapsulin system ferritin-like cargo protein n=1 Tax=Bacillus sp. FJAT-44742 TaxID=2014005 RepID=UPI000C243A1A|nr:IMEF encapsulin system ferritin-like cargo protein [Bacillus sp. FJAT-44742]